MSINITYLLGAGASCQSLPMVKDIPDALEKFAQDFSPPNLNEPNAMVSLNVSGSIAKKFLFTQKDDKNSFERYHALLQKFQKDIIWLQKESKKHSSIDTFAKKLHLQKKTSDLKRLKIILSSFFIYLQTKKFDTRYDSFFASILEDINSLPENLKILSWNYDSQFEVAFKNFTNLSIKNSKETLNICSKGLKNNLTKANSFSVFKINGTTNLITNLDKENNEYEIIEDFDIDEIKLAREFLELYDNSSIRKSQSIMSFAWEKNSNSDLFFENLKKSIINTETLIIIGYSFPFFNRKVDKSILDSMTNLKKVYVQDPNNTEDIIEKIKELIPNHNVKYQTRDKIEFKPITFKDQFFIPIEF